MSRKKARTIANHEVVLIYIYICIDILLSQSKLIPAPPSLLNQKFSIIASAILGVAAEKRKAEKAAAKAAAKAAGIAPKPKASRKRKTPEQEEEIDPAEDSDSWPVDQDLDMVDSADFGGDEVDE